MRVLPKKIPGVLLYPNNYSSLSSYHSYPNKYTGIEFDILTIRIKKPGTSDFWIVVKAFRNGEINVKSWHAGYRFNRIFRKVYKALEYVNERISLGFMNVAEQYKESAKILLEEAPKIILMRLKIFYKQILRREYLYEKEVLPLINFDINKLEKENETMTYELIKDVINSFKPTEYDFKRAFWACNPHMISGTTKEYRYIPIFYKNTNITIVEEGRLRCKQIVTEYVIEEGKSVLKCSISEGYINLSTDTNEFEYTQKTPSEYISKEDVSLMLEEMEATPDKPSITALCIADFLRSEKYKREMLKKLILVYFGRHYEKSIGKLFSETEECCGNELYYKKISKDRLEDLFILTQSSDFFYELHQLDDFIWGSYCKKEGKLLDKNIIYYKPVFDEKPIMIKNGQQYLKCERIAFTDADLHIKPNIIKGYIRLCDNDNTIQFFAESDKEYISMHDFLMFERELGAHEIFKRDCDGVEYNNQLFSIMDNDFKLLKKLTLMLFNNCDIIINIDELENYKG